MKAAIQTVYDMFSIIAFRSDEHNRQVRREIVLGVLPHANGWQWIPLAGTQRYQICTCCALCNFSVQGLRKNVYMPVCVPCAYVLPTQSIPHNVV
jgi:hypothetical protein